MSDDVSRVKETIDVVDLVGEYVQLKPAGVNHKGLCPFHNEKSPSFMVNRERQSWHCFGCNKGGDIFSFVQEMEGLDFREALKMLADKAGVQLTHTISNVESSQKNRVKDVVREAARFFHHFLLKMDASVPARDYLTQRGLTTETIERWQIGFVSDQWDLLTKYLLKKGYSIDDLIASGLTIKRDGADTRSGRGFYDRFRGRIMFPIWDAHDTVVGFTGRVLVETEYSGGKYVNTPQTILYDKSRVVFGLNKAKQAIKSQNLIVMVEGQMDVIACHQAGMENVVATSGTALTEQQIALLKRYSNTMSMAFDMDDAGIAAAKRGIDMAIESGMNVKVIQIPEGAGKDPDECIKQNKDVWIDAVAHATGIMEWYLDRAFMHRSITDPRDKQMIANDILAEIARIPYAVERDHWVGELSHRLGVDMSVLREDLVRISREIKQKRIGGVRSPDIGTKTAKVSESRLTLLLDRLFALLMIQPELLSHIPQEFFHYTSFSTGVHTDLYEIAKIRYTQGTLGDISQIRATYAHEKENPIDVLLLLGEREFGDFVVEKRIREIIDLATRIRLEWVKDRTAVLQSQIIEAEKTGNVEKMQKLLIEFQQLR